MTTQQQTHRHIQNLFSVLSDALNDIGVIATINVLRKGRNGSLDESDIHLTAKAVCECFGIPMNVLFGKSRKYPRKYAFAIWVYLSYTKLNYTLPDLVNYTHKSLSTISKAKGSIDNRKNVTAFEKKINEKLDECILIINQIKSE